MVSGLAPLSSVDVVPARVLPRNPAIKSADDVACALEEVACGDSRVSNAQKACDEAVRLAKATFQKKTVFNLFGRDVNWADRRAELVGAIEEFATAKEHRATLFADGVKTREFTFGTIKFRGHGASIALRSGEDAKSVLSKIEDKCEILKKILELLGKLKLFKQPLRTFVRIKNELNQAGLKAAWSEGLLSDEEVGELGFKKVAAGETFSIEIGEYLVQSERRNA